MKYYVKCAKRKFLCQTGNPWAACIKALISWTADEQAATKQGEVCEDSIVLELNTVFEVSKKGFEYHDDDIQITLEEVIALLMLMDDPPEEGLT